MSEEPFIIDPDQPTEDETAEVQDSSVIVPDEQLPDQLLLVPLRQRPLFPKMMAPVLVEDDAVKKVLMDALQDGGQRHIGLLLLRPNDDPFPEPPESGEDFFEVGVVARIVQISPPQAGAPLQLLVQVIERFDALEIIADPPVFQAKVKYWVEAEYENNEELKAYSVAVIDAIKELVNLSPLFKEGLSLLLENINVNEPASLADLSASMTTASSEELQQVLETESVRVRIEQTLLLLKKEIEISNLKVEIHQRIEERLSKQQRDFFLREQLKEIKEELGLSKDDKEAEVEKFQKRLSALTLSEEAEKRVNEEIEKLQLLEPSSPEFNVTRSYLDWLTVLPWGIYTEDNYDIQKAADILDEDHYGLDDVKDRILEFISVGIIKGDLAGSIILLIGPPGVGKTSIGRSIARALGRKFYRFSVGGMRDEAEIKGHRRTYIGAMPGKFIQAIKTAESSNAIIMIDEIDKIGASFQGDPGSALLEVLDPEQNREFLDHYLDVRFDLSNILFVCTANQFETIPGPLLDRMETIRLSGYILEEKLEITKRHLLPKQLAEHGLTPEQVSLPDAVLRDMIDGYAREAGVRNLENNVKKLLRKAAMTIVRDKVDQVEITIDDLPELLGRRVFATEQVYDEPRVGVVMGLAYTSMGGATLYIEAIPVRSQSPGFKQTGQLGQVMIESSEIAYTYIRSLISDDEDLVDFFRHHFIHLHVPAGATPKDGPSAGITMATALYSLVKNQPLPKGVAMTGELTLSGLVMPIGGVKEKTIAAKRAGVTTIIFPSENQPDFEELNDHIKAGLTAHFAKTFADVKQICFPDV
ncbi:MAG: endopeptidase La [Chloroflexota bacterium]